MVGNSNFLQSEGLINSVPLHIPGYVKFPAYALPFTGADIILGAAWLSTLGSHIADYPTYTIKFYTTNQFITLVGDPSLAYVRNRKQSTISSFQTINSYRSHCLSLHYSVRDTIPLDLAVVLSKFSSIFELPIRLPPSRSHDHSIVLKEGVNAIKVRPYSYPVSQKSKIEKMVNDILKEGLIQPSNSPFSSLVLLVRKKDGTWSYCTDYRALNAVTIKDSFPIPTVDELLDEQHGSQFFSKLDLCSRYHQILIRPEDRYKMAFHTHHGLYEWLVMPFGFSNAPATFQALMNKVFRPYLRQFFLVFFDDILVYSASWTLHLEHLTTDLARSSVIRKFSKCAFGEQHVKYLGHMLTGAGVDMDLQKGKTLNMSSAYHPRSDGQSEALNKCLELYLRCFVFDNPRTWITFLTWAEFWYNSAFQTSIGMTAFKVLYGREPPSIIPSFAAMDTPNFIGPVSYKLALPSESRIHPVLHISNLKPCIDEPNDQYVLFPLLSTMEGPLLQPTKLLDSRKVRVQNEWVAQQWDGIDTTTWESWNTLQQKYPNLDLEDKVCRIGEKCYVPVNKRP
ncbi:ty3-gypsy retrotransposon protein [Tanacetum coccineum]